MTVTINGTTGLAGIDGSASTPAVQGGDTNTGVFFPAADTVAIATGGTEAVRVNSSQNVGIGTSSPSNFSGYTTLSINNATNGAIANFLVNGTETGRLQAFSNTFALAAKGASAVMTFETNGSERARIDSSGNLLVGTTTSDLSSGVGYKFVASATNPYMGIVNTASTNANNNYHLYSTGASAYRFYVGLAGTVFATNTTISAISDQRFKENIRDLDIGLNAIMALKPRKFDWKAGKGKDIQNDRGFIAQEFEQVFPDLIDEWKDPAPEGEEPYKSVRADLIPVLVKAVQELTAKLDAAEARISQLEQA